VAARVSSTSAVSYVQSGNGHLYLGIVVLDGGCLLPWLKVQSRVEIQDGRQIVSSTMCFKVRGLSLVFL
jgi:hypothetical protein